MIAVEWVSETSNDINDQYHCQPVKILLNSVAVKAPRHLYSKNVSLKLFNDTQPYLNECIIKLDCNNYSNIYRKQNDLGMLSPSI